MSRYSQVLLAAGASTLCAIAWLINCVLDVTLPVISSLRQDALMTLLWAGVALFWWMRWRRERSLAADMRKEGGRL